MSRVKKTCQAYFAELIAVVSNILCNIKIQLGSEDMTNSISGVLTFIWGVIFGDIQNHILQYNLSYSDARVLKFGKYMQRKSTKDSQEAEFWILDFFRFYWFFSVFKARGGSGVTFACLAHMKVPFIAEQPLFTERRYHFVSKSFWFFFENMSEIVDKIAKMSGIFGQNWPYFQKISKILKSVPKIFRYYIGVPLVQISAS